MYATDNSLRGLWSQMDSDASQALETARLCSSLTIPSLFPEQGVGGKWQANYQSLGSQGVNQVASQLLLELFPFDRPPVRYEPDLDRSAFEDPDTELVYDTLTAALELRTQKLMEHSQLRAAVSEGLLYYLVGGPMLFDFREERPRTHRLENYRLARTPRGEVMTLLIREGLPLSMVPEHVDLRSLYAPGSSSMDTHPHLFTVVQRERNGSYTSWQEIAAPWRGQGMSGGFVRNSAPKSYRTWEDTPFPLAGFEWRDCEHYPHGFVERALGDLLGYEGLSKANLESAFVASQQKWLVDPTSGITRAEDLWMSPNGAVIPGREIDVGTLNQRDRMPDLSWSFQREEVLRRALSEQMLLYLSARRDGERVTAQEDQSVTLALNRGLGVGYSQLAPFQVHVGKLYLKRLRRDQEASAVIDLLEELSGKPLDMRVTAGVEMLGQQESLQRMSVATNVITQAFGPEAFASITSLERFASMVFNAVGLPRPKFILTPREQAQRAQQAQVAQTAPAVASEIVKQAGNQLQAGV